MRVAIINPWLKSVTVKDVDTKGIPVWHILGYVSFDGKGKSLPLAGMGILFGGADEDGNDVGLGSYISEQFCRDAVRWTEFYSTGELEPTTEGPNWVKIGSPILKKGL